MRRLILFPILPSLRFFAISALSALICSVCLFASAADSVLYQNDFEKVQPGKPPEDMAVLDGNFEVKAESTNRFLELPGAPLDNFSVQFGPAETNSISVSATIRSTAKGRRFPSFGIGLYGVAGFKLQVSPAKKSVELYKDQTLLACAPFDWKSADWTTLRLQARQTANEVWKVEGKAWSQGSPEPSARMISAENKPDSLLSGRASLFGSPFSGTPIQFDNLKVESVEKR